MKALGKIIHVQQFLKATLLVCPKRVASSFILEFLLCAYYIQD